MYSSLIIIVSLALVAEQAFAKPQSQYAQQPQHYTVLQSDNKLPADLKFEYPVQQFNEIESNKPTQNQVNIKVNPSQAAVQLENVIFNLT